MVEVKHVSKAYGKKQVIDDVTLQIPKGKITAFIGPNGAGKSTMLGMVSRLLTKDNGEILIDDREISAYKSDELAKKLSILKQDNPLNVRLTVKELVSFGRFPYSKGRLTSEDEAFVKQAIDYMDLASIQNQFLDQLSGGQRQRAFVAMTIAQNTDCILLDEPLNNLDMKHSVQMMKILRQLVSDFGKTICIVLHDINFASCYADYIVAFKDGKVIREGSTTEMIDRVVLYEIFDMDIPIELIQGQKICVYFS